MKFSKITYDLFEIAKARIEDPEKLLWETLSEARLSAEAGLGMIVSVF
ncbi:MAG: hypothetical protein AAB268_10880 [Elusimicrobiota bacterium]